MVAPLAWGQFGLDTEAREAFSVGKPFAGAVGLITGLVMYGLSADGGCTQPLTMALPTNVRTLTAYLTEGNQHAAINTGCKETPSRA